MYKYFCITNSDLNNHLLNKGFEPIHSNSEKSIYVKNEEVHMTIIGWSRGKPDRGFYSKGFYELTERGLEIELMLWEKK